MFLFVILYDKPYKYPCIAYIVRLGMLGSSLEFQSAVSAKTPPPAGKGASCCTRGSILPLFYFFHFVYFGKSIIAVPHCSYPFCFAGRRLMMRLHTFVKCLFHPFAYLYYIFSICRPLHTRMYIFITLMFSFDK